MTIQKLGKYALLVVLATGMFACNKDDNTTSFTVIGDVFVTKRLINDQEMFAKSYFAYGNDAMETAEVTTIDGDTYELEPTSSYENIYAKLPTASDYTTDIPEEENYQFNVVNEGIPHQSTDLLLFDDLQFPVITEVSLENYVLSVDWETGDDAEAYIVQLINQSGSIVFSSQILSTQYTHFEIESTNISGTWATGYPVVGDTYTLELSAVIFDPEAGDVDYEFHIQEIAISENDITWE